MRLLSVQIVVGLACLSAYAWADISFNAFPTTVQIGQTYNFTWTATRNYTYTIWLVRSTNGAPLVLALLVSGLTFNSTNGNLTWTVPSNLAVTSKYGFLCEAFSVPANSSEFGMGQSPFFSISASTSTNSSQSTTATASTISGTVYPTSSATSTAIPAQTHNGRLSSGAIAGIVVGLIVALGMLAAYAVFYIWRKKRSGIQQRQAAARASRLEPVMPKGSYEMQTKSQPTAQVCSC